MACQNCHGWTSQFHSLDEILLLRAPGPLYLDPVWIHFSSLQHQLSKRKIEQGLLNLFGPR